MDVRELREKNDKELLDILEDQREAVFNLRFQKGFGQLDDDNAIRNTKRDIARILTILRERELETSGEKPKGEAPAAQERKPRKKSASNLVKKPKKRQ
jgi:large subunit ribosomal protein L29